MRSLPFSKLFSVLLLCFAVLFAASALFAWTGPTAAPPSNNVSAPVNVGSVNQVKDGGLSLNGLAVFGNTLLSGDAITYLNFGTTALVNGYGFRDNSGTMEYKNAGGAWAPFQGGSDPSDPGGTSGYTGSYTVTGASYTKSANNAIYAYGTFTITPILKIDVVDGITKSVTEVSGTAVLNSASDPNGRPRCDVNKQWCNADNIVSGVNKTAELICKSSGYNYVNYTRSGSGGAFGKIDATGTSFVPGDQSCDSCDHINQVFCSI